MSGADRARARRIRRRGLVVGLVGAVLFGPGLYELARLSLRQRRLDRELARLSADHERLLRERTRLESDPAYVEGLIRATFKVAKPGEYVIPLEPSSSSSP